MKNKVYVVHSKIAPAGSFDTFDVKIFANKESAETYELELTEQLNDEYAEDLEDDPSCIEVYTLEMEII